MMSKAHEETVGWFNSTAVSVEKYFLWSSLALVVIFAWMEPAGASGIGFWKGLVFWTIQLSLLIPLLITTQTYASHFIKIKVRQAPWLQTALSGVVAALLFVPMAYFLDLVFAIPDNAVSAGLVPGLIDEASGVVVPVTVTWLALNAPWIVQLDFSKRHVARGSRQSVCQQEAPSNETQQASRFLQELRSRASGDLISISSELHYVRVLTTDREVMFLYNLKDAIDELPANSGVQIHRSHWVSREHVRELVKKDGASECILSNGRRLPVSRRKYSEVHDVLVAASS